MGFDFRLGGIRGGEKGLLIGWEGGGMWGGESDRM